MKNNISFKNIFKLLSMAFALLVVSFFGKAASTGVSFSLKDILEPYQANADEPGEGSDFGSFGMDGCADSSGTGGGYDADGSYSGAGTGGWGDDGGGGGGGDGGGGGGGDGGGGGGGC